MDSQVPFNCCDQIASIKLLTAKVKNNKKKKKERLCLQPHIYNTLINKEFKADWNSLRKNYIYYNIYYKEASRHSDSETKLTLGSDPDISQPIPTGQKNKKKTRHLLK